MTAVAVELCGCSHAARMHERDEDAENGRGACMARGGDCGCSEFRPGMVDVEVPDPPVEAEVVGAPRVVAIAEPTVTAPLFECPAADCVRSFPSPQGLAMHRRRAHEGYDPNRKPEPGTEAEAPAAAVPPAAAGDLAQDDDGQDCSNCGDTVIALSPRGWCDGCEEEAEAASSVVEKCDIGPAGPVVVDRDVVLVTLVRALETVVDGDACELVQMALDIQRYMDDRGWRVIDGGERP